MRALFSQVQAELKLVLRDRTGSFFAVLLPLVTVAFFGYLNREGQVGSISYASFLLPGGIGIVVAGVSFETLGTSLARQRDDGILKRLGGTPLRAWTLVGAKVLAATTVILAQTLLMVIITVLVFKARITGSLLRTSMVLLAGVLAFVAMGFALAGLCSNADVAAAAAHAVALPMQFFCGTLFPVEETPLLLQYLARALPMTYFVDALRGAMLANKEPTAYVVDWMVLISSLVISFIVAVRTFRWVQQE